MSFFDLDTERDIIAHMNTDHADAILAWVQAFTDRQDASTARMISIDAQGTDIECTTPAGAAQVRVVFTPPLDTPASVRGKLIRLSREAREQLALRD